LHWFLDILSEISGVIAVSMVRHVVMPLLYTALSIYLCVIIIHILYSAKSRKVAALIKLE